MTRKNLRNLHDALALELRLKKREGHGTTAHKSAQPLPQGPGEVRIVGGRWKRTRLHVALRPGLRPTPERLRGTLFNWLGQDLTGWRCLDAFAGTGALGLEAASRGAVQVRLVEQDGTLVRQLERVVQQLDACATVQIQRGCGVAALEHSAPGHWDAVFLDPPFAAQDMFVPALRAAAAAITPQGFIYLEAPRVWSPDELAPLGLILQRHARAAAVQAHLLQRLPV